MHNASWDIACRLLWELLLSAFGTFVIHVSSEIEKSTFSKTCPKQTVMPKETCSRINAWPDIAQLLCSPDYHVRLLASLGEG